MWLRLYQSASIWLVSALSLAPTQRSILPQVQMGLRPIASRIAAAAARMTRVRIQARRDMKPRLSRAAPLANHGPSADMRRHAARLRSRLRRKRRRSKALNDSGFGDLGRPGRADRGRDGGNRAVQPPL